SFKMLSLSTSGQYSELPSHILFAGPAYPVRLIWIDPLKFVSSIQQQCAFSAASSNARLYTLLPNSNSISLEDNSLILVVIPPVCSSITALRMESSSSLVIVLYKFAKWPNIISPINTKLICLLSQFQGYFGCYSRIIQGNL